MNEIVLTHIGGPTVLLEMDGWRILTDPTFDLPGRRYSFGFGTSSVKTEAPALSLADLGHIDAVLLSHDHHADNLDDIGRALLPKVPTVVTTVPGCRRLAAANVRALRPWSSTRLEQPGKRPIVVTATPGRHGPFLSRPIAGAVIGFAVQRETEMQTAVWFSGDSVYYRGLKHVGRRLDVDVAVLHLGAVRLGLTGPVRFSMNAAQAIELIALLRPRIAVPVHTDGWSHFSEGATSAREVFRRAPAAVRSTIRWLIPGVPATIESLGRARSIS
ncbi:L-ascorbate metabolism protein UlaG (beta-lactamase superfamily) [Mycetocola sp. CAN_C7]|uniref:MBL fold metallo-hydrolase n=1 Tax=Mycetocola sp. CAN_C7 TaxID=2787724 RepID=UPI0018C995F2